MSTDWNDLVDGFIEGRTARDALEQARMRIGVSDEARTSIDETLAVATGIERVLGGVSVPEAGLSRVIEAIRASADVPQVPAWWGAPDAGASSDPLGAATADLIEGRGGASEVADLADLQKLVAGLDAAFADAAASAPPGAIDRCLQRVRAIGQEADVAAAFLTDARDEDRAAEESYRLTPRFGTMPPRDVLAASKDDTLGPADPDERPREPRPSDESAEHPDRGD